MAHIPTDDASLVEHLRRSGLEAECIAPRTFVGRFTKHGRVFPVRVHVDADGLLCLAIVPFLRSPGDPARAAVLYERLLRLNHRLVMAKFAIDDDLDVFLEVEYPTAELDASEIKDAVDVLAHYAGRLHDELAAL